MTGSSCASSSATAWSLVTPINEGIHLGEPLGRERVPAEDERDDTDLAGVAEEFAD